MGKMRPVTPEEVGKDMAKMLVSFNAALIKEKINTEIAEELTKRVAGAACSNGDGQCSALGRIPGGELMRSVNG